MKNSSYSFSESEDQGCESLGQYGEYLPPPKDTPEAVFDALWSTAKEIWPSDTTKAEEWVKQQAVRYGVAEAKAQAASVAGSPVTLLVLGGIVVWMLTRRR